MARSRRWDELSAPAKVLLMLLTAVQVSLAVTAWADLAGRSPDEVDGSKRRWAALIALNFVGPVLYFTRGRRRPRTIGPSSGPANGAATWRRAGASGGATNGTRPPGTDRPFRR